MRHAAQRTIEFQDLLPADPSSMGFKQNVVGESFLKALRDWEKRRGITPINIPRSRRQEQQPATQKPEPKPRPAKKTREELLARKRERSRQRWAEMSPERKAVEMKRIHAWSAARKEVAK